MRDRTQLPTQQQNPRVKAYAIINNENDYSYLGDGLLEIVTDADMIQSQHYIEVFLEDSKQIFMRSRLSIKNNYERQKNTVILWNDPEQMLSNSLALTFENPQTCDMYWRVLCSKIGKNYLQINGREKLEMPNEKNIKTLPQRVKSSYNLIAYHVLNSKDYMIALWQTLKKMNKNSPVKPIQILRSLLYNFDPKIMQVFLSDPNFSNFLDIYGRQCNINFNGLYQQNGGVHELIQLSETVRHKIEVSLRAKFVKQCVIDHSKDSMIESMLTQVIKDSEIEILINVFHDGAIPKIINLYQKAKQGLKQDQEKVTRNIITFFLECVWILRIHHSGVQIKMIFLKSFYSQGALKILGAMLSEGHFKVLQILSSLAILDAETFQTQLTNDYRNDSNNLIRIICKQFSQSPKDQFVDQTVNFIKSLSPLVAVEKKLFQFFNKTLIISIFCSCKIPERILPLIYVCITQLGACKAIFEHITKFKYFDTIKEKIKKKQLSKEHILLVIKIIKVVLQVNKTEKYGRNSEDTVVINRTIINSGLFEEILSLINIEKQKNNLLVSAIISIVMFISDMKFSEFTKVVKKFKFENIQKLGLLNKYLKTISYIQDDLEKEYLGNLQSDALRKKHHRSLLEQQLEEEYLMQDQKQEELKSEGVKSKDIIETRAKQINMVDSMKKLMEMKVQIRNKSKQEENQDAILRKQLKDRIARLKAEKEAPDTIEFNEEGLTDL